MGECGFPAFQCASSSSVVSCLQVNSKVCPFESESLVCGPIRGREKEVSLRLRHKGLNGMRKTNSIFFKSDETRMQVGLFTL